MGEIMKVTERTKTKVEYQIFDPNGRYLYGGMAPPKKFEGIKGRCIGRGGQVQELQNILTGEKT